MFDAEMKILWDLFIVIPAVSVALIGAVDWAVRNWLGKYHKNNIKEDNNE